MRGELEQIVGKSVEEGKKGSREWGNKEVDEEGEEEKGKGEGDEEREKQIVEEAQVREFAEVVEEKRQDSGVDCESKGDRRAEGGGEEIDPLGSGGKFLAFCDCAAGKEGRKRSQDRRVEKEKTDAAAE